MTADLIYFELDGSIPSKKNRHRVLINSRTGKGFVRSDKTYQEWEEAAAMRLMLQKGQCSGVDFPIEKCEHIKITIYYGDKRKKDNSNVVESIHDALVRAQILKDDNWVITGRTIQIPVYREKEPGCLIEIKLLKEL